MLLDKPISKHLKDRIDIYDAEGNRHYTATHDWNSVERTEIAIKMLLNAGHKFVVLIHFKPLKHGVTGSMYNSGMCEVYTSNVTEPRGFYCIASREINSKHTAKDVLNFTMKELKNL